MIRTKAWIAVVGAAALGAAGPTLAGLLDPSHTAAAAPRYPPSKRTTFLLSRALDGGLPDGPSRNPSVSGDGRFARAIAYESDASNLVPGDTNGLTDVFVTYRRKPWGAEGTPWQIRGNA